MNRVGLLYGTKEVRTCTQTPARTHTCVFCDRELSRRVDLSCEHFIENLGTATGIFELSGGSREKKAWFEEKASKSRGTKE
ncbi:hypothetical protein Q8A67_003878 [Cirrhinus molitorella]|uniref:Uncharacterized protein n=1 Tax=Cirrhinus molitorella TaxID=172907 RepID=A0AA88TVK6_9TELE|nr:hypothetical protein Q8A67_003878 [Cirrhinus molitorella]